MDWQVIAGRSPAWGPCTCRWPVTDENTRLLEIDAAAGPGKGRRGCGRAVRLRRHGICEVGARYQHAPCPSTLTCHPTRAIEAQRGVSRTWGQPPQLAQRHGSARRWPQGTKRLKNSDIRWPRREQVRPSTTHVPVTALDCAAPQHLELQVAGYRGTPGRPGRGKGGEARFTPPSRV